jgi:hypothetical protein
MACAPGSIYHGCHAFCANGINIEQELNIYNCDTFFQTCNSSITKYGMCAEHFKALNLPQHFHDVPDIFLLLATYVSDPNQYPIVFFDMFMKNLGITDDVLAKALLDASCFWLLNDSYFSYIILFGYRSLIVLPETDLIFDENITYVFVLDRICQILPWLMDGNEDLESLGIDYSQMLMIKWGKLVSMVVKGFMILLGATGLPRLLNKFSSIWKDAWQTRVLYWLNFYSNNAEFSISIAKDLLLHLIDNVQIPANFSVEDPTPIQSQIDNFQQTVVEMENTLKNADELS